MKASNVLDNLCMEKVAARTYRDKSGNKISAQELIDSHGGLRYVARNGKKIENDIKAKRLKGIGLLAQTRDGKYKVRVRSDKRIDILREPYALNNSNEFDAKKALKHNSSFGNALLTESFNTGKPLFPRKPNSNGKRVNKRNLPSGRIPEVILGTALLTAAGTKAYDSISKRKEKKKEEEKRECK